MGSPGVPRVHHDLKRPWAGVFEGPAPDSDVGSTANEFEKAVEGPGGAAACQAKFLAVWVRDPRGEDGDGVGGRGDGVDGGAHGEARSTMSARPAPAGAVFR